MTASQFVKIMLALEMNIREVRQLLLCALPKIEEIKKSALEMSNELSNVENPSSEEFEMHVRLLQIADGLFDGGKKNILWCRKHKCQATHIDPNGNPWCNPDLPGVMGQCDVYPTTFETLMPEE